MQEVIGWRQSRKTGAAISPATGIEPVAVFINDLQRSGGNAAGRTFWAGRNESRHERRGRDKYRFGTVAGHGPVHTGRQRRGTDAAGRAGAAGAGWTVLAMRMMVAIMHRNVARGVVRGRHVAGKGGVRMMCMHLCTRPLCRAARQHCRRGNSLYGKHSEQQPQQECLAKSKHFLSLSQGPIFPSPGR